MSALQQALGASLAGERLTREQARSAMSEAVSGAADPVVLGGFLCALAARGESPAEIAGCVDALREAMQPFEHDHADAIDTAGTGGDGLGTFNLSTAAALVAAAAGARVIKHGNRSVSSQCGSADLLEAAGVPLDLSPAAARAVLDEVGITFLMAPAYHTALRHAAPVRSALGVRTLFNLVGPLLNPGRVRRQILGVGDGQRVLMLRDVLRALGHEAAYVIHGHGGADELTLGGPNVCEVVGRAPGTAFDAASLGLTPAPVEALAGGDATRNLTLLRELLQGARGPLADAVALNAAAALVVAGVARDAADGVARAREALASGEAERRMTRWIDVASAARDRVAS